MQSQVGPLHPPTMLEAPVSDVRTMRRARGSAWLLGALLLVVSAAGLALLVPGLVGPGAAQAFSTAAYLAAWMKSRSAGSALC